MNRDVMTPEQYNNLIREYTDFKKTLEKSKSMITILKKDSLYYREGTSDKVYHLSLERISNADEYTVKYAYGRRGSALKTGSKNSSPMSISSAKMLYDATLREKLAKGYQPMISTGNPAKSIPVVAEKNSLGFAPNLLTPIDDVGLNNALASPTWIAQPKMDGVRLFLEKKTESGKPVVYGYNRKGVSVPVPVEVVESVQAANAYYEDGCPDFLLDGELIGDQYYAFDLLRLNGKDHRISSFYNRYNFLTQLFEDLGDEHIRIVPIAKDHEEKRELYQSLKLGNKEGIVFKQQAAGYYSGRTGYALKYKFYSTASCVVVQLNGNKRSVGLKVYDKNDDSVFVGNCTIPMNHPVPQYGDIVEIKYLYAYPGGSLYQPSYLGVRNDLHYNDCTIDQLKYKSSEEDEEENN